jgi:large subunit ribosomal protein L10
MAISRTQKEAITSLLENQVVPQKAVVLLTTGGANESLNSELNFKVRSHSRKQGVVIKVVKNTLIERTFSSVPKLTGPTYLAFLEDSSAGDEVLVPKIIVDLVKTEFKENFGIVGSVVNGEFLDSTKTVQLSKTPSFDESMATIAGMLQTLTSKIAIGVKELPAGVARGVSAYSKTLS